VGEEDSTVAVAAHFVEVAEEGFTVVEASTAGAAQLTAADAPSADIVAVASAVAAAMAGVAGAMAGAGGATAGAAEVMAGDLVLASGGRIGVGDWDGGIRTATATPHGITCPTTTILIRLTHTTVLQAIRILATRTVIPGRQIPTRRPRLIRMDPQDPGDHLHREARPTRTTQTATSRPLECVDLFSPLTRRT
jgi:hypothetical protein